MKCFERLLTASVLMVCILALGPAVAGVNKALRFDGTDDYVGIYNDLGDLSNFSFEAWVKIDAGAGSGMIYGNYWPFQVRFGLTSIQLATSIGSFTMNTPSNAGQWVYLAFVRSGTTVTGYRNGVRVSAGSLSSGTVDFGSAAIGAISDDGGGSSVRFKGCIDEIRISQTARSASEIQQAWNSGSGRIFRSDPNTVALWHFDENAGSVVYDFSDTGGYEGMLRPVFPSNHPAWVDGFAFPSPAGDIQAFTPDIYSRLGIRPLVAVSGTAATDKVKVTLDGNSVYESQGGLPLKLSFPVNLRTLSSGSHTLVFTLSDAGNNVLKSVTKTWTKPMSGIPHVGIDENNALCVDGTQIPFIYTSWMANGDVPSNPECGWLTYKPFALNCECFYGCSHLAECPAPLKTYMDWGWAHGCYQIQGMDFNDIPGTVGIAKNHPGMLMYQWQDEPDLNGQDAATVRSWTTSTRALDPQHPVIINFAGGASETDVSLYWKHMARSYFYPRFVTDVYMFDFYPKTMASPRQYNIPLEAAFSKLATVCDNYLTWTHGQVPVFSYVQPCQEQEGDLPAPTVAELRLTYWINLIHGIRGIGWFTFFVRTPDANFQEMSRLCAQTWRLQPVIFSPDLEGVVTDQELSGGRIDIMSKEYNGNIYIFAANMKNSAQSCKFTINGIVSGAVADVDEESRSITVTNSQFTDSFAPFAVHIYKVAGSTSGMADRRPNQPITPTLTFYPNPAGNAVKVDLGRDFGTLCVYNMHGCLVSEMPVQNGQTIRLDQNAGLKNGLYLIGIDGQREMRKIMLVK